MNSILVSSAFFYVYNIHLINHILYQGQSIPKKMHGASNLLALVTLILLVLFSLLSLLFYIVIFTPYKSCKEPTITNYFVTDYAICKTIVNNEFN